MNVRTGKGGRTDFINCLIESRKYKSYLEIGVRRTCDNFDHIQCLSKVAVDPNFLQIQNKSQHNYFEMTSDDFFKQNNKKYDIIFIDGLHLEYQVTRDIDNSLECLNEGGCIVMHDCNPPTEQHQIEEYDGKSSWNGTVWKSFVKKRSRKDLYMFTVDADCGLGFIEFGEQENLIDISEENITWKNLEQNREHWLNLVSPEMITFEVE